MHFHIFGMNFAENKTTTENKFIVNNVRINLTFSSCLIYIKQIFLKDSN